jgi:enhancer of polycomb-like protein
VPAPPAEESHDINYDQLYALEYPNPSTYIRFSQTVEECTGCQYDMTSDDDTYLKAYHSKRPVQSQCSEDDFEKIMELFESTADRQAPFAAVDNTVISYEVMEFALKEEVDEKIQAFAKDIYEYWKTRRQCSSNRPLQPSLKFEMHQDSDDGDPYVCFRRRDVRQTRKTRARDVQSTEKLRRLRKELEEGRQLVAMAHQRELAKRELIALDRQIFEQRARVKDIRIRLAIKADDEDLINQKVCTRISISSVAIMERTNSRQPQKRKPTEVPPSQRQPGTQLRLPVRPDGRPLEADLTLLSDLLAQKENLLQAEIDQKIQQHQRWNQNHIDLTREPLSPVRSEDKNAGFRSATAQYLLTPPASVSSESSDPLSPVHEKDEAASFHFASSSEEVEIQEKPAYRRRIGRLGRLWIDRRGLPLPAKKMNESIVDRWKYDHDDDDEQPVVYEVDPYDTKAIKFRATIPSAPLIFSRRPQQELVPSNSHVTNGTAGSPPTRPSSSAVPPNAPT